MVMATPVQAVEAQVNNKEQRTQAEIHQKEKVLRMDRKSFLSLKKW